MIDQEGIKSLEKGASDIRLTGNMGESSPAQEIIKAGIPEDMTMDEAFEIFIQSEGRAPKSVPELLEFFKNRTLSEGPVLPNDPTEPVNPFGPKPIGPPLPDRQMAAFGGIMGLDQRRQYGIGSSFKKALNKVAKPFTKIARKITPKELAGPLRTVAPFLPPGYREAAYFLGTAKQKGKINIADLAFMTAPYARFKEAPVGQGTFGTDTTFRFGTAQPGDYGIRDLITGGEAGGAYEQRGGKGLLGKIKLGESDLGQMSDEFIFGDPDATGMETLKDKQGIVQEPTYNQKLFDKQYSGILGSGGEMSVLGGIGDAPGIMDSKAGRLLFGKKGTSDLSMLKLGSWGIGIYSGIKAGKYRDEMEAAQAAEDALLAENKAASEAEIQAARDWAKETFGSMSVYAEGGRIGYGLGNLVKKSGIAQPVSGLAIKLDSPVRSGDLLGSYYPDPSKMLTAKPMSNSGGMGGMLSKLINNNPQIFNNLKNVSSNNKGLGLNSMVINLIKNNQEVLDNFIDENNNGIDDRREIATGGRINRNMGGEFNMPPGGLSPLQTQSSDVTPPGMELDLRDGGFIPIGKAEKADDVPARVSKNEFVFTADAVKAAGGGSVNKGAKRMYDTMKRLESQVV